MMNRLLSSVCDLSSRCCGAVQVSFFCENVQKIGAERIWLISLFFQKLETGSTILFRQLVGVLFSVTWLVEQRHLLSRVGENAGLQQKLLVSIAAQFSGIHISSKCTGSSSHLQLGLFVLLCNTCRAEFGELVYKVQRSWRWRMTSAKRKSQESKFVRLTHHTHSLTN